MSILPFTGELTHPDLALTQLLHLLSAARCTPDGDFSFCSWRALVFGRGDDFLAGFGQPKHNAGLGTDNFASHYNP